MRYRMLLLGCTLSAQEPERETAKEARIFRLPEFERAFLCVRYFEGWHSEKNHPYVGWGHCLQPGEKYSARTMTRQQADELLRKPSEVLRHVPASGKGFAAPGYISL